ncbi:MAG: ATP-binding protein [Acidobacteriota bacterium]
MDTKVKLTPAQTRVAAQLREAMKTSPTLMLRCAPGMGRTTILRHLHAEEGGALVGMRTFLDTLAARNPAAIEESFLAMMERTLAAHDSVLVDDLQLVTDITDSYSYPRANLLDGVLSVIVDEAAAAGKKLILATDLISTTDVIERRGHLVKLSEFGVEDYRHLLDSFLSETLAAGVETAKVHRFAPALNGWQLKNACSGIAHRESLNTEEFVEYLSSLHMVSNVDLSEVQAVSWTDLKGMEDVIEALEAKIALPLENDALAAELHLKARRGVLLAGPPGTGKTTIGRALAHRLKSKFFLIDGTVIAGSNKFYCEVENIFAKAKRNAPSVIFIDDADLIFEDDDHKGFYRYLLTMLDGLESESVGRVCVMMTAMDAASLPPALVRSDRIELWLRTRLPEIEARMEILQACLQGLPAICAEVALRVVAEEGAGLTGADIKSAVEDGKLLLAYDLSLGRPVLPLEEYLLRAMTTIRENRKSYRKKRPGPPAEVVKIGFAIEEE